MSKVVKSLVQLDEVIFRERGSPISGMCTEAKSFMRRHAIGLESRCELRPKPEIFGRVSVPPITVPCGVFDIPTNEG